MIGLHRAYQLKKNEHLILFALAFFIIPIFIQNCSDSRKSSSPSEVFIELSENTILISDSDANILSDISIYDSFVDQYGDFYFSDFYSRRIVKTQPPFENYTQVGENGTGPGEYAAPAHIDIYGNSLFYSDNAVPLIKSMAVNDNEEYIALNIPVMSGGLRLAADDSHFVYYDKNRNFITYYNLSDNGAGDSLRINIELNGDYDINNRLNGGGIQIYKNRIYAIPVAPYSIFSYDIDSKSEKVQISPSAEENLEHLPGVVSWSGDLNNQLQKHRGSARKEIELFNSFTPVWNFEIIESTNGMFFLVTLKKESGKIFHLIDSSYNLVASLEMDATLVGYVNDIIYFIEYDRETDLQYLKLYKLNI